MSVVDNFGFLITSYEQLDDTRSNIIRIRDRYKIFNKCPIVVVTSTRNKVDFKSLENLRDNIEVVEFPEAPWPGNNHWYHDQDKVKHQHYISIGHQFLPPCLFMSMELGLHAIYKKVKYCLHIHGDTYWREEQEQNLELYAEMLANYTVLIDTSTAEEATHDLPKNMSWHPEGMFLNLDRCYDIGFGFKFSDIFRDSCDFHSKNYGSPEGLFGQWMEYCLTGKSLNNHEDKLSDKFIKEVYIICDRMYHGHFPYGLTNLP